MPHEVHMGTFEFACSKNRAVLSGTSQVEPRQKERGRSGLGCFYSSLPYPPGKCSQMSP